MQVSIIIPSLNRYQHLNSLLDGISRWPSQPDEIIIVDQTPFVMGPGNYPDLSDLQRHIQHVKVDFRGPCKARNTGARLAHGDLLWFLDDDMAPHSEIDLVVYIREHFRRHPRTVLNGTFSSNPVAIEMKQRFDMLRHLSQNWNSFVTDYRMSLGIMSGNFVVAKDVFVALGGFDERYDPNGAFEDRDLGLRCFYEGYLVLQSKSFHLPHIGASSGGRRQEPQPASTSYFWSKYMSEDNYYIQAFAYWLSRTRFSACRSLIRFFVRKILRIPPYVDMTSCG